MAASSSQPEASSLPSFFHSHPQRANSTAQGLFSSRSCQKWTIWRSFQRRARLCSPWFELGKSASSAECQNSKLASKDFFGRKLQKSLEASLAWLCTPISSVTGKWRCQRILAGVLWLFTSISSACFLGHRPFCVLLPWRLD